MACTLNENLIRKFKNILGNDYCFYSDVLHEMYLEAKKKSLEKGDVLNEEAFKDYMMMFTYTAFLVLLKNKGESKSGTMKGYVTRFQLTKRRKSKRSKRGPSKRASKARSVKFSQTGGGKKSYIAALIYLLYCSFTLYDSHRMLMEVAQIPPDMNSMDVTFQARAENLRKDIYTIGTFQKFPYTRPASWFSFFLNVGRDIIALIDHFTKQTMEAMLKQSFARILYDSTYSTGKRCIRDFDMIFTESNLRAIARTSGMLNEYGEAIGNELVDIRATTFKQPKYPSTELALLPKRKKAAQDLLSLFTNPEEENEIELDAEPRPSTGPEYGPQPNPAQPASRSSARDAFNIIKGSIFSAAVGLAAAGTKTVEVVGSVKDAFNDGLTMASDVYESTLAARAAYKKGTASCLYEGFTKGMTRGRIREFELKNEAIERNRQWILAVSEASGEYKSSLYYFITSIGGFLGVIFHNRRKTLSIKQQNANTQLRIEQTVDRKLQALMQRHAPQLLQPIQLEAQLAPMQIQGPQELQLVPPPPPPRPLRGQALRDQLLEPIQQLAPVVPLPELMPPPHALPMFALPQREPIVFTSNKPIARGMSRPQTRMNRNGRRVPVMPGEEEEISIYDIFTGRYRVDYLKLINESPDRSRYIFKLVTNHVEPFLYSLALAGSVMRTSMGIVYEEGGIRYLISQGQMRQLPDMYQ